MNASVLVSPAYGGNLVVNNVLSLEGGWGVHVTEVDIGLCGVGVIPFTVMKGLVNAGLMAK